jgi:hypothetical protein
MLLDLNFWLSFAVAVPAAVGGALIGERVVGWVFGVVR